MEIINIALVAFVGAFCLFIGFQAGNQTSPNKQENRANKQDEYNETPFIIDSDDNIVLVEPLISLQKRKAQLVPSNEASLIQRIERLINNDLICPNLHRQLAIELGQHLIRKESAEIQALKGKLKIESPRFLSVVYEARLEAFKRLNP